MRDDVRKELIEIARAGKTITYSQLMKKFHIPRGHPKPGIGIGSVVGKISGFEDKNNRPLISAIVVRSNSASKICPQGHPGGGFFGIPSSAIPAQLRRGASRQGDPNLSKEDLEFVRDMQEKIWRFWKQNRPSTQR